MITSLQRGFQEDQSRAEAACAAELLGIMIQEEQYVGEVYSLGFEFALVSIHDRFRQDVGGIPSLSFLLATRLHPGGEIDFRKEDSSVILLRVLDAAALPNDPEAARVRVESAQRAAGESGTHWDDPEIMDASTAHLLSFAGVKCRVLGTFFLDEASEGASQPLRLRFGSDLSNYYPNRGLKVYKPRGDALRRIVNYRDPRRVDISGTGVQVGVVRYASSDRPFQGTNDVVVEIVPENFLAQKSAFFGMSRTGKSNTTKVVARSVFDLRFAEESPKRIGQLIFDYNGEYANENVQDGPNATNPTAIRNIWKAQPGGQADDVVTFGSIRHRNDLGRRIMLVNFYADGNLQIGKEVIESHLSSETSQYVSEFRGFAFAGPPRRDEFDTQGEFRSTQTRYARRVLAYRALLSYAGYLVPPGLNPQLTGLFSQALRTALADPVANDKSNYANDYAQAAVTLGRATASWDQVATAMVALGRFVVDTRSAYRDFNVTYMQTSTNGDEWADPGLKAILGMFSNTGGRRLVAKALPMHTTTTQDDYRAEIYRALVEGRLVIVDQSGGDEAVNRASADRIMLYIFEQQKEVFRAGNEPPDVLVYVEEAQNLLPPGSETDTKNIWARSAKEGAKFRIALLYATQEVSGIQKAILKNTANFFISHLNNTDETKELVKYYDFEDFESSIRRAEDQGFLRVKTLSNKFTVPVQIHRFVVGA
jgi:hypothetical protein